MRFFCLFFENSSRAYVEIWWGERETDFVQNFWDSHREDHFILKMNIFNAKKISFCRFHYSFYHGN